jgi:glyoxylase-like metal-dependent hydrolase (beta-lactamase superfamily II)
MFEFRIGDVRITRVVEMEGPVPGTFLFRDATPEAVGRHEWLREHFATSGGKLHSAIQGLVVESGGRRILVDTCVGNDKVRANPHWNRLQGRFLEDLAAAGHPAPAIDTVVCTHLHVDHVGWNTRLHEGRWMPTFERARYLFGRTEWEHWSKHPDSDDGPVIEDSVQPVVDAGLADLVEPDHRITDEVCLEPTPGHTPGHVSVRIRSRGEEAIITGDMMHHPVQCAEPDWASNFDVDAEAARVTRRRCLERWHGEGAQVFGTHFSTPTAGRIERDGEAWRFAV